ncbi:MAG: SET domain-containing protein-lysine N-methyltransferase [Thermomicrobiales bacterium]
MTMDDAVIVKEAGYKGKGVFALRAHRQGDCILRFQGRVVHRDELAALTPWEREHLGELTAETYQILPSPRCYINHACLPNAYSTNDAVYAWREIAAGAEITIDYRLNAHDDGDVWEMLCRCGAQSEPHVVIGDFFSLSDEQQARYLPYAPAFIREEYRRRRGS